MKPTIKIIIAREGLIIISLLLLAIISFFSEQWVNNKKNAYKSNAKEIMPVTKMSEGYLQPQGIILQFPKNTNNDVIKNSIKREFPNITSDDWIEFDSPEGQNVNAYYNEKGERILSNIIYNINFSYSYIFFLIFAYPLYLTARFILWAIVTLKEKYQN